MNAPTGTIETEQGVNLLEPGETPLENAQFLLFLLAVVNAVGKYPDILRVLERSQEVYYV